MASYLPRPTLATVFALSLAGAPALAAPCLLTPDEHGCVDQRAVAAARKHKVTPPSKPAAAPVEAAPFPGPKGPPRMLTPQRDDR